MQQEDHIDIYFHRSILFANGGMKEFHEGRQDAETLANAATIKKAFADGFYESVFQSLEKFDPATVAPASREVTDRLLSKLTSEAGRALVGLTVLQLAIKHIAPSQDIRLHKGSPDGNAFSWQKGISMRVLDKNFNTPFLREHDLLNLNADGLMMTRSLAENYPYTRLYKADMRGPFNEWMELVEGIEEGTISPLPTLQYLLHRLSDRAAKTMRLAETACLIVERKTKDSFQKVMKTLNSFFEKTQYSARAFEVVLHSFMQAYTELKITGYSLSPLTQMRSANKKHKNVGDIELKDGPLIIEAWDAKYGKPYLLDELDELGEKLVSHPSVKVAGFIVNKDAYRGEDVLEKISDVACISGAEEICILNFREWIDRHILGLSPQEQKKLGLLWLKCVAETFGRKRMEIAPMDEPSDGWLRDLIEELQAR